MTHHLKKPSITRHQFLHMHRIGLLGATNSVYHPSTMGEPYEEGRQKQWPCQLCNTREGVTFKCPLLVGHVKDEHADSFPLECLGLVEGWPSTPIIGLDACPLCHVKGFGDSPGLIKHVLQHAHAFSLRSLPWADLPPGSLSSNLLAPTNLKAFPRQDLVDSWVNEQQRSFPL